MAVSVLLILLTLAACDPTATERVERSLSAHEASENSIGLTGPFVGKLGALRNGVVVRRAPDTAAPVLGALRAGARIDHGAMIRGPGCAEGFLPVSPRGYVCADQKITRRLEHPTLTAMAAAPQLEAEVPYSYARTRGPTPLFVPDGTNQDGIVSLEQKLPPAIFAVIGSYQGYDRFDRREELVLLTSGHFVRRSAIERPELPPALGVEQNQTGLELPLAFPRGSTLTVHDRAEHGSNTRKKAIRERAIPLSGRSQNTDQGELVETKTGTWLERDQLVVARPRHQLPEGIDDQENWADVDVEGMVLVAYRGRLAISASPLLGLPQKVARRGLTRVRAKHVTTWPATPEALPQGDTETDPAWVIELESGLVIRAALRAHPVGTRLPGEVLELAPGDARRLFTWLSPSLPPDWHAVMANEETSKVVVR